LVECVQNQILKGTCSGTGPRPTKALVLGCVDGAREGGIAAALGSTPQYAMLKYAYTIKACIMENIEKGYTGRYIYIFF
jgi:hypothetical protein